MKKDWNKIVGYSIGFGLLFYGLFKNVKSLKFGVRDYSISDLNLSAGTAVLKINIYIKNPLLVGVLVRAITGDVYAQGVKVGNVNTTYDYKISGRKTHILPILVNLNLSNVGSAVMQNIATGDIKTLELRFDGFVAVGEYYTNIPVKLNFNYDDLTK